VIFLTIYVDEMKDTCIFLFCYSSSWWRIRVAEMNTKSC